MENASTSKRARVNFSLGGFVVCLLSMSLTEKETLRFYPDSSPSYISLLFPTPNAISNIQNVFTNTYPIQINFHDIFLLSGKTKYRVTLANFIHATIT